MMAEFVLQVLGSTGLTFVMGPWNLIKLLGSVFGTWSGFAVQLTRVICQAAQSCWATLKVGAQVAPAMAGSAKDVGSQVQLDYLSVLLFPLLRCFVFGD